MNIAIRVDASNQIGTGHFMRCLTLADALQQRGAQIRFVSRHLPEHLKTLLKAKGHEFKPLNSIQTSETSESLPYTHWLGTSQAQDSTDTLQALAGEKWDWLVVDHYALDAHWESSLRKAAKNILVIDDIANRQHDCDVLLDQNFYANRETRYIGKVPAHCQLLLGPRYALLRDEFRHLREQVKPRTGPVKRMLLFFGGIDADNYTAHAIKALANIGNSDLHVDVVIGAQHPFREQIESSCNDRGFVCHVQTSRMAELMAAADLAIGAAGSTTWERCFLGLPTLTLCAADNQREQMMNAASEGLLYALAPKDELSLAMNRHLSVLMENSYLRSLISHNGMKAVDGRGVFRVMRSLSCTGMEIRVATHDDSAKVFEWRNHPTIRTVSRNTDNIDWESHQKWFASALTAPDKILLMGQRKGLPVGVVRFDIQNNEAEVSIYLVPGSTQYGDGSDLLQSAERWLFASRPEIGQVRAHVLGDNKRSQYLFLGAGYQVESSHYSKRLH